MKEIQEEIKEKKKHVKIDEVPDKNIKKPELISEKKES